MVRKNEAAGQAVLASIGRLRKVFSTLVAPGREQILGRTRDRLLGKIKAASSRSIQGRRFRKKPRKGVRVVAGRIPTHPFMVTVKVKTVGEEKRWGGGENESVLALYADLARVSPCRTQSSSDFLTRGKIVEASGG